VRNPRTGASIRWSGMRALSRTAKTIKIKGFPKHHKVKLFRVEVSTHRTDWVVTNDLTQDSSLATQDACGLRWKIEQFHREAKQLTGIERCQCRQSAHPAQSHRLRRAGVDSSR